MTNETDNETTKAPSLSADASAGGADATLAERPRRVRRTRQVDKEDAPETAATAQDTGAASETRTASATGAPAPRAPERSGARRGPRDAGASKDGPRAPRGPRGPREQRNSREQGNPREQRDARPARPPREMPSASPRPARSAAPAASSVLSVNRSNKRTIYRQDVVGTPPVLPASEPKKSPDQLMLVWHPAPKVATPARKTEKPMTAKEALKAKLAKQVHAPAPKDAVKVPESKSTVDAAWIKVGAEGALDAARAAGDGGEALVQAWLDAGNVDAITRLAALDYAPNVARKAARRALNVLKSRGVSPAAPSPAPVKPVTPEAASDCVASFIPPDGNGTTFYSFSQRLPGGRYRVADIMVRENAGIVHASLGHLAGKHIRRWKDRVEDSMGVPPVEVLLDWARQAVAEGRKLNDVSKQILPLGFDGCMVLTAPAPSVAPAHPIAALEKEATKAELEAALVDADKLHNEPEFGTWAADRGALQELVSKVGERLSAADAEDRNTVDKVLEEEAAAATDRYFTTERRETIAARMRAAAISVRARRGDELARRILVVAEAVRRGGLVTDAPRENPFLRAFFQKGMAMMARENQNRFAAPARNATVG
jgi:hypothetical protein